MQHFIKNIRIHFEKKFMSLNKSQIFGILEPRLWNEQK